MAVEVEVDTLRGLLIQDPRLTYQDGFNVALSSVTQAGPLPGVPVAQQDTPMVLEALGAQAAGGALRVKLQASGMPGDARVIWRNEGDTLWRGWDGPQVLAGFEFVSRSAVAGARTRSHAITLSDRSVLVVSEQDTSQKVRVYRRDPDTAAWSSVEVFDDGATSAVGVWPCLLDLGGGRVMLFSWREAGSRRQIRIWSSADSGLTWSKGQQSCIGGSGIVAADYLPGRIRAALVSGSILMITHLVDVGATLDEIRQWASDDLGASFTRVSTLSGSVARGFPEILPTDDGVIVAYLAYRAATTPNVLPYVRRLSSAWESLEIVDSDAVDVSGSLEWGSRTGTAFSSGELAAARAEDGALYLIGRDHAAGALDELYVVCSTDGGETWSAVGMDSDGAATGATPWAGRSGSIYPRDIAATWLEGRVLLSHRFGGGTASDSLCAAYLGGWSAVTMPLSSSATDDILDQIGWRRTWLPYSTPDTLGGWAAATTGAPTISLGTTGMLISHTTGADSATWTLAQTTGLSDGCIALAQIEADAGTGYLEVQISDGVGESYRVRVSVTTTTITLRDITAASDIATITTTAGTTGVQILIGCRKTGGSGRVGAWYRAADSDSDRAWISIGTSTALTSGALTAAQVVIGTLVAGTATVRFSLAACTSGTYTGTQIQGQSNPAEITGRTLGGTLYLDGGTLIRATDGPGFQGDVWNIDARYRYGIERLHPEVSSSPRQRWRSLDVAQQVIAWKVGEDLTDLHAPMDRLMGVYLGGINFRLAELHGRDSGGTWTKLLDLDAGVGMTSLGYQREGAIIRPRAAAGGTASTYLQMDAYKGGTFSNGSEVRRIRTNTDGSWGQQGTGRRVAQLLLESYETTDGTVGNTGEIWSPEVVATFTTSPGEAWNAFKLVIPAQATAEGYFEIGVCLIGPVIVLGDGYSLGRGLGTAGSWEQTETRGGVRSFRAAAPARRTADIDWSEGVDTSQITETDPSPDFVRGTAGSGGIVAAVGAAPWLVPGLYRWLEGALKPLVYLPGFSVDAATAPVNLANRGRFLYGRIVTETLTVESIVGQEWGGDGESGELMRVGRVRIEEEL